MAQYGLDFYPPDYQTNPYCVEYARSGRATCQGCKELIDKGDLRLGSPVQFPEQGVSYKWRHFRCLTQAVLNNMRGKIGRHNLEAAIIGLDKLRAQDRRRVERTLGEEGMAAAKGDSSEEEGGATSSEGDEEQEEEEEGVEARPAPQMKKGGKKKAAAAAAEEEEEEEAAAHKPAPKTPKKGAPARRAPRLAAKRRAQHEDSDEDYQPGKHARGRRASK